MPQIPAFVWHCDNFETCGTPDVIQSSSALPNGWANVTAAVTNSPGALPPQYSLSMLLCNVDVQKMAVLLSTAFSPVWTAIGQQAPPPPPLP
jgi:hypothetical protein